MTNYFAKFGRQVVRNGWPLVILQAGSKKPMFEGWESKTYTPAGVAKRIEANRDYGIGIRCGNIVGLDDDYEEGGPVTAEFIKAIDEVKRHFFPKALYRRGRPTRPLMRIIRLRGGDTIKSMNIGKFQILGEGRQFVAYNIHPETNKPYVWMKDGGGGPASVAMENVPAYKKAHVLEFIKAVQLIEETFGIAPKAVSDVVSRIKEGNYKPAEELVADEELVSKACEYLTNKPEWGWDEWNNNIMLPLWGASGGADWGLELAHKVSGRHDAYDREYTEKRWEQITKSPPERIGAGTIFWQARQNGMSPTHIRGTGDLPDVKIRDGELMRMVDETEEALVASEENIFQQGGRMVRPVWDPIMTHEGKAHVMRISAVQPPTLHEVLPTIVNFMKYNARSKSWDIANTPKSVVEAFMAREGQWKLRYLLGVVTSPTLRTDGTVLDKPGYDALSGLLYDPRMVKYPTISENPTRNEAKRALQTLLVPLSEFPFVSKQDQATALSAIFTAVVRRAMPVAPMHAFSAPAAGSGKSFLVDVASMIATGDTVAVMSTGQDKYEFEKRLTGQALAGEQVISIDNVREPLQGDFLCQLVTQEKVTVRPLGRSDSFKIPNTSALYATGNNLVVAGDLTRRTLMCTIDSGEERPELRKFKFNAVAYARKHRPELVAAVLTIIRAYIVSEEDPPTGPLASFEKWSQFVRYPIMWLTGQDPVSTMETIRKSDPELDALRSVAAAWHKTIKTKPVIVRDVVKLTPATDDEGEYLYPDLRDALLEVAGDRGNSVNPRTLAWWLRKNKGRAVRIPGSPKVHHFDIADDRGQHVKWALVER